jgi:hypothetical protein
LADNPGPSNPKTGSIKVTVVDAITNAPLIGASIMVTDSRMGAAADIEGRASIRNIGAGGYSLSISLIGYEPTSLTDVMVRPERTTFVTAKLKPSAIETEGIVVSRGFFNDARSRPTSTTGYNAEEIRRSPGTAGDVSRILNILPGVAKVDDQMNNLVVRGGTPAEIGFYIDNIEIPNINHYPVQGASGGPIGLINTDFIQNVTFSAGGFPASYGDRLSSVMDIDFREGNHDEFDSQLDLHMAGFGAIVEGPFAKRKGSYLVSARRSFLDFLVDAIGTGVAPKYSDYQAKIVYDLTRSDKLTFLGIGGIDFIEFGKQQSIDDGNVVYGKYEGFEYASGLNWMHIWNHRGYSNTSLSVLGVRTEDQFFETKSDQLLTDNVNNDRVAQVRNINVYQLGRTEFIEFGFDSKYYFNKYDINYGSYTNALGDTVPPLVFEDEARTPKIGLFASVTFNPVDPLTTTAGVRYDFFDYTGHSHVSPRLSFALRLSERLSITGATGIYYQNLPLNFLAQKDANKELRDIVSQHYILGTGYLLTENTKLSLEGYYKDYDNFPLDPDQPQFFAADAVSYYGFFGNYERLLDLGVARSYGIEAIVQKKLVTGIYGLVSLSYSKAEYKALDNAWRDRMFDNRIIGGIEGGFKPNNRWEFSARWIYAGGVPYTPLDLEASRSINRSVLDGARVNAERYPDYHSLNLRVDRRFLFARTNLIVYFSIWNAYNRKNVSTYYWNETEQKQDVRYQWTTLPIFGIEYEF